MVATKTELSNKKEFKGDILDRSYSVHHDPQSGTYSYDYADVTPVIAAELEKIKYYRVSSASLKEVEEELAKYLKGMNPIASRIKGEISEAAEAETKAYKEAESVFNDLNKKNSLTENEEKAYNKAATNINRAARIKVARNAMKRMRNLEEEKNTGVELTEKEKGDLEDAKYIIDAFEELEKLEEKEKKNSLTEEEKKRKQQKIDFLNTMPTTLVTSKQTTANVLEQREFNNARAKVTELEGLSIDPDKLPADKRKEYNEAATILRTYLDKYPERANILKAQYADLNKLYESKKTESSNNNVNITGFFPNNNTKSGGRRKTKRTKKSKRKTLRRKH